MRIFKSLLGWLCFLSLMAAIVSAGLWVYTLGMPFFHGAELHSFPGPNTLEMAHEIGSRGTAADNGALLKQYAKRRVTPTERLTGWDAVNWIVNHGRIPKPGPESSVSVIAVLDESGRVVSAYPGHLVGEAFPFGLPIGSLQDSVNTVAGYTRSAPADYSYPTWCRSFINTARVFDPNANTVYMNRIVSPQGHTIGVLVVASPRDLVTLYQPSVPYEWWPANSKRNLAIIAFLFYLILLPVWAGMDAAWRGMRPFAWGILVALTGWIGLLAYLIARLPAPGECYNCGEKVLGKYVRCPSCGVDLSSRCPVCRRKMKPGWQYCPTCRGIQPEPVEVPPAPVPAEITRPASTAASSLQVTALDAETGIPIQGASIMIKGPTGLGGVTNAHGGFDARKLKNGLYLVTALKQGWESATAELEIGENGGEAATLRLRALPGIIAGRVISRALQTPIVGARVYLDSSRLDRSGETNSDGRYVLEGIPSGPYTVRAEAEDFAEQTKLAQVAPDQQFMLDFALDAAKENSDG